MFAGFTDDARRLVTGLSVGFQVFQLPSSTSTQDVQFSRIRNEATLGGVSCVAVNSQTNIIAIVGTTGSSGLTLIPERCVMLFDTDRDDVVSQLHFDDPVIALRINRKRLCCITEHAVHTFDLELLNPLPLVRTISPPNPQALCALSSWSASSDSCYMVVPQSGVPDEPTRGDVFLVQAADFSKVTLIPAHKTSVSVVEFCYNGARFATSSVRGNVIRVFACPTGQLLFTFRRGQKEATIYSLGLNAEGTMVAATSSTGTLHIFRESAEATTAEGAKSFAKDPTRMERTLCCLSNDGATLSVVACSLAAGENSTVKQYVVEKERLRFLQEYPF